MAQDPDAATAGSPAVSTHVASCDAVDVAFRATCRRARLVAFLSLRELSYSMSPSRTDRRHVLRSAAVSCHCVVEMFDCFKVSLSESFQRRSGRPTALDLRNNALIQIREDDNSKDSIASNKCEHLA